ncbi:MAG: hypothetical protein EOO60_14150 [Hymenobacter sp.]|nr:MAG: hypothetical protein EOO60_14150 [Hymenobacter sp.]
MEYNCYEDAYAALVKDNDGVLPDLYEITDITISSQLCNLLENLTVADIVAHALVEVSRLKSSEPSRLPATTESLYVAVPTGEPLHLDKLLDQAVASLN